MPPVVGEKYGNKFFLCDSSVAFDPTASLSANCACELREMVLQLLQLIGGGNSLNLFENELKSD